MPSPAVALPAQHSGPARLLLSTVDRPKQSGNRIAFFFAMIDRTSVVLISLLHFIILSGAFVYLPRQQQQRVDFSFTLPSSPTATRLFADVRSLPNEDESWFVKTEQFCKPFPEVKPHLESHRTWVADLRSKGYCITSGYRVDAEGKPGGGGLMLFAAKNYAEAKELVKQDPLVANDCVDWRLNGWIPEVGDVQLL